MNAEPQPGEVDPDPQGHAIFETFWILIRIVDVDTDPHYNLCGSSSLVFIHLTWSLVTASRRFTRTIGLTVVFFLLSYFLFKLLQLVILI